MALHDSDKDSNDRSSPLPNSHDANFKAQDGHIYPTRPAHGTLSTNPIADSTNPRTTRISFKTNVILYYDDHNRIIRVDGFIPSLAAYPVTIIAQYGYDVYADILGLTPPS